MKLTVLGTGSAMPSPTRLQTGYHLTRGGDHLLVDCGSGVVHRLAQIGIDFRAVDQVLLTHHHLDHVADLPTLAKARVLADCPTLAVHGPPGTAAVCEQLFAIDDLNSRLSLTVTEHPIKSERIDLGQWRPRAVETVHSKPGFAFRFGDSVVISGDTEPTPEIAALADGARVLLHECAYPDSVETETHTTPTALGKAISDCEIDRIYLTHLFPETESVAADLVATVESYTDATVAVAEDLETVRL